MKNNELLIVFNIWLWVRVSVFSEQNFNRILELLFYIYKFINLIFSV